MPLKIKFLFSEPKKCENFNINAEILNSLYSILVFINTTKTPRYQIALQVRNIQNSYMVFIFYVFQKVEVFAGSIFFIIFMYYVLLIVQLYFYDSLK